jgi:hypothetical protein
VRLLAARLLVVALPSLAPSADATLPLTIDAPPALATAAARLRAINAQELADTLATAGLEIPLQINVTLIPEDDARARETPRWIVGQAFGAREVVIFPARTHQYPYDSLESVMRHEVVHLALNARAGGRMLPRWFHEGVATSVEAGWGVTDQLRLLVASVRDPAIADVSRLFRSTAQRDTTLAYLLATILVDDLRERHGSTVPGRIAEHVAHGVPFPRAFAIEAGETPDAAATRAWRAYRRWINWLPSVTSGTALWTVILMLAAFAFAMRRVRRVQQRRAWDEEESGFGRQGSGIPKDSGNGEEGGGPFSC